MQRVPHTLMVSLGVLVAIGIVASVCVPVGLRYIRTGSKSPRTLRYLTKQLTSADPRVRESAVAGIAGFGEDASPLVPRLLPLLSDESVAVRRACASALISIKPKGDQAAKALVRALEDDDDFVRGYAAMALSEMPGQVDVAAPGLIRATQDPDRAVRIAAIKALPGWQA